MSIYNKEFSYGFLCEKHNKQGLRHILQIELCDGFCGVGDTCEEFKEWVKKCSDCTGTDIADVLPYFDGDHFRDENDKKIKLDIVANYAET